MRVWIDTDVGDNADDAVALVLARRHPSANVVAVSVVGADPDRRVAAATDLVGPDVPVHRDAGPHDVTSAAPDVVVAIGPLTNVARWWRPSPRPAPRLVVMGGALAPVHHRGRVREVETNFGADPAAARSVLSAGADVTLVPLDVTSRMVLSSEQVERLLSACPELRPAVQAWPAALCLHDPLALLVALDDADARQERMHLEVDPDGRLVEGGGDPSVGVVVEVDVPGAIERILAIAARPPE